MTEGRRVTVLEMKDEERQRMRRYYTSYFRATGRMSVYLTDPVIILGEAADIKVHIPLDTEFHLTGDAGVNEYGTYLKVKETDEIKEIQKRLGLRLMDTGIHLDMEKTPILFPVDLKRIRIESIALAELGENTFRIIYRKRLSMGR